MKLPVSILALGLCAATSASASDFFIGLGIGKSTLDVDDKSRIYDGKVGDSPSLDLRLGFDNDTYRVYGMMSAARETISKPYLSGTAEAELGYLEMTGAVDFFLPVAGGLKAFAGPHLGFGFVTSKLSYENKLNGYKDSDIDVLGGLVYGGQAGALYEFNEHFQVELGYRYSLTNIDGEMDYGSAFVEHDVKVNSVSRFYGTLNYVF